MNLIEFNQVKHLQAYFSNEQSLCSLKSRTAAYIKHTVSLSDQLKKINAVEMSVLMILLGLIRRQKTGGIIITLLNVDDELSHKTVAFKTFNPFCFAVFHISKGCF